MALQRCSLAQSQELRNELRNCSWHRLAQGSVDDAVHYFLDYLTALCHQYIPRERIVTRSQTHPWLDAACQTAIERKSQAENTDAYE